MLHNMALNNMLNALTKTNGKHASAIGQKFGIVCQLHLQPLPNQNLAVGRYKGLGHKTVQGTAIN